MPRPCKCRKVGQALKCTAFKPCGVPRALLEVVNISLDEIEAVRLADLEGLYHEAGAACLGVSRQTFGNIVKAARRKIAEALTCAKALRIEGGTVKMEEKNFSCSACGHAWFAAPEKERPPACPCCWRKTVRQTMAASAKTVHQRSLNNRPRREGAGT